MFGASWIDPNPSQLLESCIAAADTDESSGFKSPYFGSMPHLREFMAFTYVDRTVSQSKIRQPNDTINMTKLWTYRNFMKYTMLSLPCRDSLDVDLSSQLMVRQYECTRLTVIIYSNSVDWVVPPTSDGVRVAIRSLRKELESSDLADWMDKAPAFVLWLLLVGGLAAYRTAQWPFFVLGLRKWSQASAVTSLEEVRAMVEPFVWSTEACDRGTQLLWQEVCDRAD
jgi:hypothetical protein